MQSFFYYHPSQVAHRTIIESSLLLTLLLLQSFAQVARASYNRQSSPCPSQSSATPVIRDPLPRACRQLDITPIEHSSMPGPRFRSQAQQVNCVFSIPWPSRGISSRNTKFCFGEEGERRLLSRVWGSGSAMRNTCICRLTK